MSEREPVVERADSTQDTVSSDSDEQPVVEREQPVVERADSTQDTVSSSSDEDTPQDNQGAHNNPTALGVFDSYKGKCQSCGKGEDNGVELYDGCCFYCSNKGYDMVEYAKTHQLCKECAWPPKDADLEKTKCPIPDHPAGHSWNVGLISHEYCAKVAGKRERRCHQWLKGKEKLPKADGSLETVDVLKIEHPTDSGIKYTKYKCNLVNGIPEIIELISNTYN